MALPSPARLEIPPPTELHGILTIVWPGKKRIKQVGWLVKWEKRTGLKSECTERKTTPPSLDLILPSSGNSPPPLVLLSILMPSLFLFTLSERRDIVSITLVTSPDLIALEDKTEFYVVRNDDNYTSRALRLLEKRKVPSTTGEDEEWQRSSPL